MAKYHQIIDTIRVDKYTKRVEYYYFICYTLNKLKDGWRDS